MLRSLRLIVVMAVFLGGCATLHDLNKERLNSLPDHYSNFDMNLAWETRITGAGTTIDGFVKNTRYSDMTGIEIWVTALDGSGVPISRSVSYVIPNKLQIDDLAPFSLTLPVHFAPGTTLRFVYRYTANDGWESGLNWIQSFDAKAAPK